MRRIRIMNTDSFLICDKQAGSKMQLVQLQMHNTLIMFGLCVIASFVLSLNKLFDELSPLAMILLQYVIVIVLCGGFLFVLSLFDPISPKGWFEYFRSFTIPYIIIAAMYYYSLFDEAKKQNQMILEIQENKSTEKQE